MIKWSKSSRQAKEQGYSLLEILVVLAIIGTLMTLVAPRLMGNVDKSKVIAAKSQAKTLRLALDSYKLDTGNYPNKSEGLSVLITAPQSNDGSWYGPYLDGGIPKDPWGFEFIYEEPKLTDNGRASSPKIISLGADNAPGGKGINADISS